MSVGEIPLGEAGNNHMHILNWQIALPVGDTFAKAGLKVWKGLEEEEEAMLNWAVHLSALNEKGLQIRNSPSILEKL
jgi:hypothetical protein